MTKAIRNFILISFLILSLFFTANIAMGDSLSDSLHKDLYIGLGLSPVSADNKSLALGWKKYQRNRDISPAVELEYNKIQITQKNGIMVNNHMMNANLYILGNFTTNSGNSLDKAYDFGIYAMLGGGFGNNANDISFGAGVSWADIFNIGVKHTRFIRRESNIKTFSNTALVCRITIPIFPIFTLF